MSTVDGTANNGVIQMTAMTAMPSGLRLARPQSAAAALGLAVSHLMTKPAFAALPFGSWSRVLVGQINRGHYQLVVDDTGRVVGFLGWAATSEANAEAWVRGHTDVPELRDGDCIVINAWSADDPAANRLVLAAARLAICDKRLVYFKRHYKDGRTRPMRLSVNDFVAGHLGRGAG
jgi:hemolysin-activating ACP:hemolysin acyltransferase